MALPFDINEIGKSINVERGNDGKSYYFGNDGIRHAYDTAQVAAEIAPKSAGGSHQIPVDIRKNFNTGEQWAVFADGSEQPWAQWANAVSNDPGASAGIKTFAAPTTTAQNPDGTVIGSSKIYDSTTHSLLNYWDPRAWGDYTNSGGAMGATNLSAQLSGNGYNEFQTQVLQQFQNPNTGETAYYLPNQTEAEALQARRIAANDATKKQFNASALQIALTAAGMGGFNFTGLTGLDSGMPWLNSAINSGANNFITSGGDVNSAAVGALTSGAKGAAGSVLSSLNSATSSEPSWGVNPQQTGANNMDDWSWLDELINAPSSWDPLSGDSTDRSWLDELLNGGGDSAVPMPNATWTGNTNSGTYTGNTNNPTDVTQTGGGGFGGLLQSALSGLFSGSGNGAAGLGGAALAALLGQNQSGTTTSTGPWAGAQPYLIDALNRGATMAGTSPNLPAAPNFGAVPDYTTEQYLRPAIDAATQPMRDAYAEEVMPSIRSGAIANGQYGSNRQAIAEAIASNKLTTGIGNVAADMSNKLYTTNLANRTGQYTQGVANQQQTFANNQNNAIQGFTLPWTGLQNYANMAIGAAGRGNTTATNPGNNTLTNVIGGALTGIGLNKTLNA